VGFESLDKNNPDTTSTIEVQNILQVFFLEIRSASLKVMYENWYGFLIDASQDANRSVEYPDMKHTSVLYL
jgi:hypothetical protein